MFEPADFLEQSMVWAAGVLRGDITVERRRDRPQRRDLAGRTGPRQGHRGHEGARGDARAVQGTRAHRAVAVGVVRRGHRRPKARALAELAFGEDLRASLYAFDLVQRRAKRPAGVPDKSLARDVTKVGIVGAGLMASQLALLFVRRLEVPVVLTDLDQERVDKGVGSVHAEVDKLLAQGPDQRRHRQPAQGARHRIDEQGRVRRRRLRARGGLRGDEGQAAGLRRGRSRGLRRVHPGDEHVFAVGHRDGGRARTPRTGRGLPLLQPGGRCCRCSRSPAPRSPTTQPWRPRSPSARS